MLKTIYRSCETYGLSARITAVEHLQFKHTFLLLDLYDTLTGELMRVLK